MPSDNHQVFPSTAATTTTARTPLPTLDCRKWPSKSAGATTAPTRPSTPQQGSPETSHSPLLVVTPPPPSPPRPSPQPRRPRQRDHKAKTQHEKSRGKELETKFSGVDARSPCACCRRRLDAWAKKGGDESSKPRCRVARDPDKFNSYKCGYCIGSKGKCSFSVNNPGVNFEPEKLDDTLQRETAKRASREKAQETTRRRRRR
ncbi:hypothetical protein F5X97DRAFT_328681 [Nemania serpens]|nr:hypothetical protein F5X97DRAFT_328681 [Nemania serpens]